MLWASPYWFVSNTCSISTFWHITLPEGGTLPSPLNCDLDDGPLSSLISSGYLGDVAGSTPWASGGLPPLQREGETHRGGKSLEHTQKCRFPRLTALTTITTTTVHLHLHCIPNAFAFGACLSMLENYIILSHVQLIMSLSTEPVNTHTNTHKSTSLTRPRLGIITEWKWNKKIWLQKTTFLTPSFTCVELANKSKNITIK